MNWSAVNAFANIGIKYAAIFSNSDRNCPENTDIPPIFWWTDWNLSCFDEHCWATSFKHPQKMHRYNIDKIKREPIEQSLADLNAMLNTTCNNSDTDKISITNLIPQGFEGSLRLKDTGLVPAIFEHQILPDNTVVTSPLSFYYAEVKCFDAIKAENRSEEIFTDFIETKFYKVSIDIASKKIRGITEKTTNRELLDTDSPFELGQFIYTHSQGKTLPFSGYETPKTYELKIYFGDVAYIIIQKGYEEQSGAETLTQIIFYKNEKNIDVSYKNASGI